MSRSLSPAELAATQAEVVRPFMAAELDYPAGAVRATTLDRPIQLQSPKSGALETWHGCGAMAKITGLQAGSEVRSYGFEISLSGIPGNWGAYLRAQDVQGRDVYIILGFLNPDYSVMFSRTVTRAVMDTQDVEFGERTSVNVVCESVLLDWERARVRRATDVDHRERYPTDGFFRYVAAMENMTLTWGK